MLYASGILNELKYINYLIFPKLSGSRDHVYSCYAGKATVEHRYLDHENSVYLGFSMTFDKISYFFLKKYLTKGI